MKSGENKVHTIFNSKVLRRKKVCKINQSANKRKTRKVDVPCDAALRTPKLQAAIRANIVRSLVDRSDRCR